MEEKTLAQILADAPHCYLCGTKMGPGYAIEAGDDGICCRTWGPPQISTYETLRIIGCWKCPKCGHSEDSTT